MSHIVQIQTQIKSEPAVQAACSNLNLPRATHGTFELYVSTETGLGVQLPDWKYPIVADLATGELKFDNYEGRWGDRTHLNRFIQRYAVEAACIAARKQGHSVVERQLENGSIKLTSLAVAVAKRANSFVKHLANRRRKTSSQRFTRKNKRHGRSIRIPNWKMDRAKVEFLQVKF